ncbi:unnamed protein product [Caenorhabditis brenneri]
MDQIRQNTEEENDTVREDLLPKPVVPKRSYRIRRSRISQTLTARKFLIAWSVLSFFAPPFLIGVIRIQCLLLFELQVLIFSTLMIYAAVYKDHDLLVFFRGATELFLLLSLVVMAFNLCATGYDIYKAAFHSNRSYLPATYIIQAILLMTTAAFFTQFVLIDETIHEIMDEEEEADFHERDIIQN